MGNFVSLYYVLIFSDAKLNELRKWKVRTLPSIIDELGHRGRIIDAVKIDIEGPRHGYEDKTIKSILETGNLT